MNIESKMSGHWTDDQLIEHLYGVGLKDDHLATCEKCRERLASMQSKRNRIEIAAAPSDEVSFDFLAAQRRNIYRKVEQSPRWFSLGATKSWASATLTVLVLGGGLILFEQRHESSLQQSHHQAVDNKISDAQLAEQVQKMVDEPDSPATAPLQALFEE